MIDLDHVPANVLKLAAGCFLKADRLIKAFRPDELVADAVANAELFQLSILDFMAAVNWLCDWRLSEQARVIEECRRDIEELQRKRHAAKENDRAGPSPTQFTPAAPQRSVSAEGG